MDKMIEAEFAGELMRACVETIARADAPLTVSDLRGRMETLSAFRRRQEEAVERLLEERTKAGELHVWPPVPRSRKQRFWHAGFADTVADKLMQALAATPATPRQAIDRVRKILPKLTAAKAEAEARRQLHRLAAEQRLIEFRANRQTIVYFSKDWLKQFAGPPVPDPLSAAVLAAVEQLEPGRGNYVAVDEVRASSALRKAFDRTALQLARAGRLVLGGYDGPRPIPEERRREFIEDDRGNLYIAVAWPREG